MRHQNRWLIACLLVVAVAATGTATAKKKKRLKPPSCDQTVAFIQNTANRLSGELAARGFTPDEVLGHNYGYSDTCRLIRPNKRRGSGRITDYRPSGTDPDYEGQPFYEFGWSETVTRTRKGKLTSTIEGFSCRYGVQTGTGIGGGRSC
jgi:hypothetical protein